MLHFSNEVTDKLKSVSGKINDIFSDEAISLLSSKRKYKKVDDSNYKKIVSQLPNGIYSSIQDVINVIQQKKKLLVDDVIKQSGLLIRRGEIDETCKPMTFSNGNTITGRDQEIDKILTVLSRKDKRGVILAGPAGTGKTSIIRGVASRLLEGNVPKHLIGCEIFNMDLPHIFAKFKDDPIKVIINILETATKHDKYILFVDEVHQLLNQKLNDILKPYLTEKIRLIGATTDDEFHSIVTDDPAVERRFTVISVDEPSVDRTIQMVINTKNKYEEHHNCSITNDICEYLVRTGSRFLGNRRNPDKSFDILDISCTLMNKNEIQEVVPEQVQTGSQLLDLQTNIDVIWNTNYQVGNRTLTKEYIDMGISTLTNIDYTRIRNSLNYEYVVNSIKENVFGQDKQVEEIANVVNVIKHINFNQQRPLASLLLIGPSGSGKTTALKSLANSIYGSMLNYIECDLGAYRDRFSLTELKGAPPGYVGYGKSAKTIKEIRSTPQSVIHFKNANKCDPEILDYVLNSVKNGVMVDSSERSAPLNNAIVIFSITLSDKENTDVTKSSIGFSKASEKKEISTDRLEEIAGKEIVNKVESIIYFKPLTQSTLETIFNNNVDKYMSMYRDVVIDKESLKQIVLDQSKNGHHVIDKLISTIPKIIFNKTKVNSND